MVETKNEKKMQEKSIAKEEKNEKIVEEKEIKEVEKKVENEENKTAEVQKETESKEQEAKKIEIEKTEPREEPIEEKSIKEKEIEENVEEKPKSKKGIIAVVIIAIIIILAIASTIFAVLNLGSTKIMKGVSVKNIDISNLTKEEATNKLNEIYANKGETQIILTHGDFDGMITYKALEVNYQIQNAIDEAYLVGRDGNIFTNNFNILKTWIQGNNVDLHVTMDEDMIEQISKNINNNLEDAVVQPSYYIEDNKLIITTGKEGKEVNQEQLLEDIYNTIVSDTEEKQLEIPVVTVKPKEIDIDKIHEEVYKEVKDAYYTTNPFTVYPEEEGVDFDVESVKTLLQEPKDEYEIELKITKPTKTVKEIGTEAFPDLLSTFSTRYQASNANRTTNLKLAVQKINGTVLLPGQEFSYNKTLGERTIAAGYKEAAVFSNGQVVNGLGGGICQISSTLYDAVVKANLQVTVRRNHQFVTSYLPAGQDATVVYGSQDFKFVNSRSYPIRLQASVSGGVATISVWGLKEDVEYDITIETKKVATIAYTTQYIQDPSLPAGKEVVQQAGSNGRKVEAYKVMRLNGQVVSTTLLSKDTYNAMKRIVRVGTAN